MSSFKCTHVWDASKPNKWRNIRRKDGSSSRRSLANSTLVPASFDWVNKRPSMGPLRYVALRLLDDMAYGAGLTTGALKERSPEALRPDFTSWPRNKK